MPPNRAQGGTQSIEDCGALEMVTAQLKDKSELPARLALLDKLRVPRFSMAQEVSAVRQDQPDQAGRYREVLSQSHKYFEGEDQSHRMCTRCRRSVNLADRETVQGREEFTRWLLSYDVRAAAGKAVSEMTNQPMS
jgi:hypothetical protein